MVKRIECIMYGEVQGVSYRAFVKETARGLGLSGFVRNRPDDTVEVVTEGEEDVVREFVQTLKEKHPFARVERIDEVWREPTGEFPNFRVLYS